MLCLGIQYLNGSATASTAWDRDEVEWPPHPARVFMALAAAHFQTDANSDEREALLWLEALPDAPEIVAGEASPRKPVTQFVPVNDKAGPSKAQLQSAPVTRERQPRTFAKAWLESDVVFLRWPEADPPAEVRESLDSLCRKVTRIGHSSSFVQMWIDDDGEAREPNWIPNEEKAEQSMRVAGGGALAELERRFNQVQVETYGDLRVAEADSSDTKVQKAAKKRLREEFQNRQPIQLRPEIATGHGYARAERLKETPAARGSVFNSHFLVLRLSPRESDYRYLDLQCVLQITQRWREALCSHSNESPESVRTLVSGHDPSGTPVEGAHLAYVPLAFAGSEHADGHLLGMGLALPSDVAPDDRRELLQLLARMRPEGLKLGRLGVWSLDSELSQRPPLNLRPETWTAHPKGATHWASVTPVVYDRHPKAKDKAAYLDEVAGMIRDACGNIGLPKPREVIVNAVSGHLGAPPSHNFPRLKRKDGSLRRHTHAILVFDEPVCGPVLIGAGRYRGYGVFKPMQVT